MRARVIGVEFDGPLKVSFSLSPLQQMHIEVSQRSVTSASELSFSSAIAAGCARARESFPGCHGGDSDVTELV
jgi:hypothetical protein